MNPEGMLAAFAQQRGKIKVSEGGATHAGWRKDGKELFFIAAGKMMAVEASTTPSFKAGVPQPLLQTRMRAADRSSGTSARSLQDHRPTRRS